MRTINERFWSKVAIAGPDDCWEWQRSRKQDDYGQFKLSPRESPQRANRVAWMLTYGDAGMLSVLHLCDNPPCCNPRHLFLGTAADNSADMVAKGRACGPNRQSFPTWVQGVRKLSDTDISDIRQEHAGGLPCRAIARRRGVHHTTISRLVRGDSWKGYTP